MRQRVLNVGDIVQIDPTLNSAQGNPKFAGCLMVVTEPKAWGAQGYVTVPGMGLAYYRCPFALMEPTGGRVPWLVDLSQLEPDETSH
jgi:hypothetical protein